MPPSHRDKGFSKPSRISLLNGNLFQILDEIPQSPINPRDNGQREKEDLLREIREFKRIQSGKEKAMEIGGLGTMEVYVLQRRGGLMEACDDVTSEEPEVEDVRTARKEKIAFM